MKLSVTSTPYIHLSIWKQNIWG